MPTAIPIWDAVPVTGRWYNQDGTLKPGSYEVTIPVRLTSATGTKAIIPAGQFASGTLNTDSGSPSLSLSVPATDDPDIRETGWKVVVKVTFASGTETYNLDVPIAAAGTGGIDLHDYVPVAGPPPVLAASVKLGLPGGVALLDTNGDVIDSTGTPISAAAPDTGGVSGGSAQDPSSVAVGQAASTADWLYSTAAGAGASVSGGSNSTAIGYSASATGGSSTAVGETAAASGGNATAVGKGASAGAQGSAVGRNAAATMLNTAVGDGAKAETGTYSTALGQGVVNTASRQVAIGATHVESVEVATEPGNPAVNSARAYLRDAAGVTQQVIRFADGATTVLAKQGSTVDIPDAIAAKLDASQAGANGGVATLDSTGKVPATQLGASTSPTADSIAKRRAGGTLAAAAATASDDLTTLAQVQGMVQAGQMVKTLTATQTVTNTVALATLADLTATLAANSTYVVSGRIGCSDDGTAVTSSAGDVQLKVTEPAGATIAGCLSGLGTASASLTGQVRYQDIGGVNADGTNNNSRTGIFGTTGGGARTVVTVDLTVTTGVTGGDLTWQFAQSVAAAVNLSVIRGITELYITKVA